MTGCDRILARLQHGPATAAELYGLHAIVHSRVAELRKRGHVISCVRLPGESGPHAYVYSISTPPATDGRAWVGSAGGGVPRRDSAPAAEQQPESSAPGSSTDAGLAQSPGGPGAEQLTLRVAA